MRPRETQILLLLAVVASAACGGNGNSPPPPGDHLASGTWGSEGAAAIVSETQVHMHVHCTNGDFPAPIALDSTGRFSVTGSYQLRAFPVAVGPTLPAQMAGVVSGRLLTFTIAVNDTVEKRLVVLGPAILTLGREPRLDACPICMVGRPNQGLVTK